MYLDTGEWHNIHGVYCVVSRLPRIFVAMWVCVRCKQENMCRSSGDLFQVSEHCFLMVVAVIIHTCIHILPIHSNIHTFIHCQYMARLGCGHLGGGVYKSGCRNNSEWQQEVTEQLTCLKEPTLCHRGVLASLLKVVEEHGLWKTRASPLDQDTTGVQATVQEWWTLVEQVSRIHLVWVWVKTNPLVPRMDRPTNKTGLGLFRAAHHWGCQNKWHHTSRVYFLGKKGPHLWQTSLWQAS